MYNEIYSSGVEGGLIDTLDSLMILRVQNYRNNL